MDFLTEKEFFTEIKELLAQIRRRKQLAAQEIFQQHWTDENGNPAGGVSSGKGFTISWQNGPLGRAGTDERVEPNGAFVEGIIDALESRFEFYQQGSGGKFACEENARCLELLTEMKELCEARTRRRVEAGVEGTHKGN